MVDLDMVIKSISIPLYCMAPAELYELSIHLKDLLGKAFIHLNLSLWGDLILFVKKRMGLCGCVSITSS